MNYDNNGLFIDDEHLQAFGENVGRSIKPDGTGSGKGNAADLQSALKEIGRIHRLLELKWGGTGSMPGAVRWILDNHYLALREGRATCAFFRGAKDILFCGDNAVFALMCTEFISAIRCSVTKERCMSFLNGFQRSLILSSRELGLFTWGVRFALIMELKKLCRKLEQDENGAPEELFANIFNSLRYMSAADMKELLEGSDFTERALRRDPAGVYPLMSEKTRAYYRAELSRLAARYRITEYKAALEVLKLSEKASGGARHVGFYIFKMPMGQKAAAKSGAAYISAIVVLSMFLSLAAAFAAESAPAFFLLIIPISELVKSILNFIILKTTPPGHLPSMELDGGVPDSGRTLCVISALITDEKTGEKLARRMEEFAMASRDCGENLLFAILADLPDTTEKNIPGSEQWLKNAADAVSRLNAQYGCRFYLFCRDRVHSGGRWMGRERKRGAIDALMHLLRGENSELYVLSSPKSVPENIKYILTLDSDTRLEPGAVKELIGAMLHPLNVPRLDRERRMVVSGHGIISPAIATDLQSAVKSDFAGIFAGVSGRDPYSGDKNEVYSDLFQSGGFAGKGIIDIDAYLFCMRDRIPENRILSHDAVEGAFLRGGYMSRVELTDSFPGSALSYYKRLHRWVRGDWQNLPYLFRRGRDLPDIERWRLFDSLRRSLVPISSFIAIYAGLFSHSTGVYYAVAAALISLAAELIITCGETLLRREDEIKFYHYSAVYHGIGGGIVRTVMGLILLPCEAYFCLSAIVQTLWRMAVSRKNLLLWQTAAQADTGKDSAAKYYSLMPTVPAAAILLLLFSPFIMGRAAGIIWMLSPLFAWLLSLDKTGKNELSPRDKAYILARAKEIWRFFSDHMNEENFFLPPDNLQVKPPMGLARRTSPTNIGLGLLSCLAALDLGFDTKSEVMEKISGCIATLEALPKWNGHLFNWYSTDDLSVLQPAYVSTVDSGNLYACLTALHAGLEELGETTAAARCRKLMEQMDFAPLYDKSRRLFHIGCDTEKGELSRSFYDLMSSEARLTAYIAIAKGDVPRSHWEKLSRAQVQKNAYRGMASWTGTMFEYLMPELLLPLYEGSLLYESAKFCLYVQRRRAPGVPWGISESAFYSLDSSMSYRYKAHGCSALALKRGMDSELVISPYSSFLALVISPTAAVKNLRLLEEKGMLGEYGFWEALDYTNIRRRGGSPGIVKCVMSHHLGMSMISCLNCLKDGITVRRFMADPAMSAHVGLLQEKVHLGGVTVRRGEKQVPTKERPSENAAWDIGGQCENILSPRVFPLANENYSLMMSSFGTAFPKWNGLTPYLPCFSPTSPQRGINISLRIKSTKLSLLPTPGDESRFRWNADGRNLVVSGSSDIVMSTVTSGVLPEDIGESRHIRLMNPRDTALSGTLELSLMPLMAGYNDYVNHPAFYKLGLSAKIQGGYLMLRRLARGNTPELYMCIACDVPVSFYIAPGEDTERNIPDVPVSGKEMFLTEPFIKICADVKIPAGGIFDCRMTLAMGHNEKTALEAAKNALQTGDGELSVYPLVAASIIGLGSEDALRAIELLSFIYYPPAPQLSAENLRCRKQDLWACGISGDLPIICAHYPTNSCLEDAEKLMNMHLFISGCGGQFDLVFLVSDRGDYHRPLAAALTQLLNRRGGDLLDGSKGGIHILERSAAAAVEQCAALNIPLPLSGHISHREKADFPYMPMPLRKTKYSDTPLEYRWKKNGEFCFYVNSNLPPRAWSWVLTNGSFGYLPTDCGSGNMWYLNSRENQISPWSGRPGATEGPERLYLCVNGVNTSLFAANDSLPCKLSYGPGYAVWQKNIGGIITKLTAFVPMDKNARVFILDMENLPEDASVIWSCELVMSTSPADARYTVTGRDGHILRAYNSRCISRGRPFYMLSSKGFEGCTGDAASARSGNFDGKLGLFAEPCLAMKMKAGKKLILVCGCEAPESLLPLLSKAEECLENTKAHWRGLWDAFSITCGHKELEDIMNGFIGYQALACRIMARCSIYQSGGAYGFRDQLQDCVNLIPLRPELAREQILRSCARQYLEGDVQHWWHEGGETPIGVRTRCSDDLLWLPWAVSEYIEKTGDREILRVEVPYLEAPVLKPSQRDLYAPAAASDFSESVLQHCLRAIDCVISRGCGDHGLLKMGSGDWNDGMDAVMGESLWLTWFFCHTVERFSPLIASCDSEKAGSYTKVCLDLYSAANRAWDGDRFIRAYFPDGTPLGASTSPECTIDSVAQSFAAFCKGTDPKKLKTALGTACDLLFDEKNELIRLFTPSFAGKLHPGYIESYGPGFRENGGQYTHGALWLIMALFRCGETDRAFRLLKAILPGGRDVNVYKAEPYVVAADVYAAPGHEGEAGWSWYTGSAGWLFRIVTEELLGLRMRGGKLYIEPNLPAEMPGYKCRYLGHEIQVENGDIFFDGQKYIPGSGVKL